MTKKINNNIVFKINKNFAAILVILLFAGSVILAYYYGKINNQNKDTFQSNSQNIVNQEQNNKTTDNLDRLTVFEKKQKCATYKKEIYEKMETTQWTGYIIEDIFYSEQENSCLFSVVGYQESSALLGDSFVAYMIWDYLADNLIFYRDSTLTDGLDIEDVYKNAVEYLQGNATLKYKRSQWNSD